MSASTTLLLRKKRIIRGLENAGAVSPETAIPFEEIGLLFPNKCSRYTEKLIAKGLIHRTEDRKYYL